MADARQGRVVWEGWKSVENIGGNL